MKDIDDSYIKELILNYQKTGDNFQKILEHLSSFIYNFPRIVTHNCQEDIFGGYYQYLLERLPKILISYKPMENILFKTWFYLVQRRHYLNFLKSRKHLQEESSYENMESLVPDNWDFAASLFELEMSEMVVSCLSPEDLLFVKLFAPENLTVEDVNSLRTLLACPEQEFQRKLRILFDNSSSHGKKEITRLVPINKVADFLGWNRVKISKKLSKIRAKVQKINTWEE